jgi:HAD superfamily hydrolase (TIGR01549 family)
MKKYGIIFDCDGTLVDSLGHALESFNYALDRLGEPPRTIEEIKRYFGAGADRIFARLLKDERQALRAFEYYKEHQRELSGRLSLHEGVLDLLDTCRQHEVAISIVTGRHSDDLDIVLKPQGIADRFVCLVTDNQVPSPKPAPHGILLAASRMGLDPQCTFYVGDSHIDIQAAHAAGAQAVAALWDPQVVFEQMQSEKPHHFARQPADVWSIFQSFTKRSSVD